MKPTTKKITYKERITNHTIQEYTNEEIEQIEHERAKPEGQE